MQIRSYIAALTIATGLLASSQAGAFFYADERAPPNGLNGVALNGLVPNASKGDATASAKASAMTAAVLEDGSVVDLK